MKKKIIGCALMCAGVFASSLACAETGTDMNQEEIRQVLYGALDNTKASLRAAPFGTKTIALLPFSGRYEASLAGRLKNIVTMAGFTCVEAKDDPMWNEIVREVAWNERKSDILDSASVVKFGKLKAAQVLLYGAVKVLDAGKDRCYAEIELHATDIATKQHVWGGNFACRLYRGKEVQGIVSLDAGIKNLLKKNFDEAKKSLLSPEIAGKLSEVRTVAVVPLAGDIDQYMTGLAIETLTQTKHQPKNPQIPSVSQLRVAARDGQVASDAVFYGAVRDLSKTESSTARMDDKTMRTTHTVNADIQLFMEDVKTGVILWSKTITLSETVTSDRDMTAEEAAKARQEKLDAVSEVVKEDMIDNWKFYVKIIAWTLGGIVLLILLVVGIKAFASYNNVR